MTDSNKILNSKTDKYVLEDVEKNSSVISNNLDIEFSKLSLKDNKNNILSNNLKKVHLNGGLITDSEKIDKILKLNIEEYIEKYNKILKTEYELDGKFVLKNTISLYDVKTTYYKNNEYCDEKDKTVYMKPDGGIVFYVKNDIKQAILICEAKNQGTNDIKFVKKEKKQACGNAIERTAKNIRMSEMLFDTLNIFPYIIFCAGCDFHHTESISKRLEAMNYGIPNNYAEITNKELNEKIKDFNIDFTKKHNKNIATILIKAHKYDELPNGSSNWTNENVVVILDKAFLIILQELKSNTLFQ